MQVITQRPIMPHTDCTKTICPPRHKIFQNSHSYGSIGWVSLSICLPACVKKKNFNSDLIYLKSSWEVGYHREGCSTEEPQNELQYSMYS